MKILAPRRLFKPLLATLALVVGGIGPLSARGGNSGSSHDEPIPGEVLVKLDSAAVLPPLLQKYGLTLVSRFGSRPIFKLKVIGSAKAKDVVDAISLEPGVQIAEVNAAHRSPEARKNVAWAIGTPQAYMAQWAPQSMRLAQAQAVSKGAGVRVAVLDTGVDRNHPALAGRLLPGYDFVDADADPSEAVYDGSLSYGHGTHVAGLIAMVAPQARIMPLRVLDADGDGNVWVLAEALLYAIDPDGNPYTDDGAQVINLSLGSLTRTRLIDSITRIVSCSAAEVTAAAGSGVDAGYDNDRARCRGGQGAVVVVAAGNGASRSEQQYPAAESAPALVSVAATNSGGKLADFSNSGSWITLAAPGEGITSALPGGYWGTWSGTSMATPLVAGTAALLRAAQPQMKSTDLAQRLRQAGPAVCGLSMRRLDALSVLLDTRPSGNGCL